MSNPERTLVVSGILIVFVLATGIATTAIINAPYSKTEQRLEKALQEIKEENTEDALAHIIKHGLYEVDTTYTDGWGQKIRGEITVTKEIVTYEAVSSGPDKKFNTDDDMTNTYRQKNHARIAARWVTEGLKGAAGGIYEGIVGKESEVCEYCGFETVCGAKSLDGNYECTREAGHDGEHIACTGEEHEVATWEDPTDKNKKPFWKVW